MQESPFLHSARRLMLIDISMKFREDSLRGFQVKERTRFVTDRQMDGQTDGQTPGEKLPTLKGGDINIYILQSVPGWCLILNSASSHYILKSSCVLRCTILCLSIFPFLLNDFPHVAQL